MYCYILVDKNKDTIISIDWKEHLVECKEDFGTCYYIPNFISCNLEEKLLHIIYEAPENSWTKLKRRRLQCWGGKQSNQNAKFNKEAMPEWCNQLCKKMVTDGKVFDLKFEPNHILVNEYKINEGIMAHKDGPMYHPKVAIISLKSTVCLNFYLKPPSIDEIESNKHLPIAQLILEPRSCVIFSDKLYTDAFHMIHENEQETVHLSCINMDKLLLKKHQNLKPEVSVLKRNATRVSLTLRHVLT